MRLADMTVEDFRNMMDEFYAPAEKRSKLTHSEAKDADDTELEKIIDNC